ncbi:AMP-dependent synthetase [Synergistales bacterium]|nr:AMP-dependent synthetase [Synergistales bacterium]
MARLEEIIDANLKANPNDQCFWWENEWYTKTDFSRLVEDYEASLTASGFRRGQRLAVLTANCPMILAISVAVWRLGGTIAPLNVKSGAISLIGTLELIDSFAVVTSDAIDDEAGELLREHGFPCVKCAPLGALPKIEGKISSIETQDIAIIFATSGTTGLPKAVPLTHGNILSNCMGVKDALSLLDSSDVFLNALPNFHSFGYTINIALPLVINGKIAIVPSFLPPSQSINAISSSGATVIFGVPAVFSFLLAAIERGSAPKSLFSKTKYLCSGGDKLNDNLHDISLRLTGKDILEGYGLTETSPVITVDRGYATNRHGSVGPFIKDYKWQIRDEKGVNTSGDNPRTGEGVLWVKGSSVSPGYFRAPEITAERFDGDWVNTGDYVRLEDGGDDGVFVRILDRVTDIIIVGGFNVYPQEVELILHSHPAVKTAIVVGMPHPVNGEVPKAFIMKNDGAEVTELDIVRYCKERLAHFKAPRKVEFVGDFPLSSAGKILRRVLREREREQVKK